jgi:hypothetical protein
MTVDKYIYLSWSYGSDVNMLENAGGDAPRLLGQLYITHPARRTVFIEVAPGSPDIGDEPDTQHPPGVSKAMTMIPHIRLDCPRPGVVDMDLYIEGSPRQLLGQLYVNLGVLDPRIWYFPSYKGSPDIRDAPQPPSVGEAAARKGMPIARGVLDYFPAALLEVARTSRLGNEQHNPGQPMHWAYGKSADHADALLRHLIDRRELDVDGVPHVAKVAWRALALLQTYLEDQDPELHERMEDQRAKMAQGK